MEMLSYFARKIDFAVRSDAGSMVEEGETIKIVSARDRVAVNVAQGLARDPNWPTFLPEAKLKREQFRVLKVMNSEGVIETQRL